MRVTQCNRPACVLAAAGTGVGIPAGWLAGESNRKQDYVAVSRMRWRLAGRTIDRVGCEIDGERRLYREENGGWG